jgi:uncharacterized glyoxalase superfamily metalloenzyme YdcJ
MVVANGLQQQVDMLSKERDSYIDLWQQTTTELKALQKSHQVNLIYRVLPSGRFGEEPATLMGPGENTN